MNAAADNTFRPFLQVQPRRLQLLMADGCGGGDPTIGLAEGVELLLELRQRYRADLSITA